jgi:hypothetical protein
MSSHWADARWRFRRIHSAPALSNRYAERSVLCAAETLEDGSILQTFDDSSTLRFDPYSGYAFATPPIDEATQMAATASDESGLSGEESAQVAAAESEALEEGLAGRPGLDEEESVGGTMESVERSIGGSSIEGHWEVQTPSGSGNIDD